MFYLHLKELFLILFQSFYFLLRKGNYGLKLRIVVRIICIFSRSIMLLVCFLEGGKSKKKKRKINLLHTYIQLFSNCISATETCSKNKPNSQLTINCYVSMCSSTKKETALCWFCFTILASGC